MSNFKNLRDESRNSNWGKSDGKLTMEDVNCGSMLRIADSLENIAKDKVQLESELEKYKRWYNREVEKNRELESELEKLKHKNRGLRAAMTRQKNKLHDGAEPSQETNL